MKFLFLLPLLIIAHVQSKGKIELIIDGIKTDKGQIIVNVYNSPEGFPTKPNLSYKQYVSRIKNHQCQLILDELPFGEYAISVYQDANSNNKFDTNFLGIPVEKAGVSNNPNALFIPSYHDAKFTLSEALIVKKITIK